MNDQNQYRDRYLRAALTFPCVKCGVEVGSPCLTSGGTLSLTPHQKRSLRAHSAVRSNADLYKAPPQEDMADPTLVNRIVRLTEEQVKLYVKLGGDEWLRRVLALEKGIIEGKPK